MYVMNFSNDSFSIKQAKAIDLVNYLKSLGFEPKKIRRDDYWYLSPLRDEKEASFKINRRLNRWYDHGLGKGGNLVDFGIEFYKCSIPEFLNNLSGNLSLQQPIFYASETTIQQEPKIKIIEVTKLTSYPLLRYLEQRTIPVAIAQQFCKEVHYSLNDSTYYGIGFKNDSDGYEIRNKYSKICLGKKDISTIKNSSENVKIFEGFFDFLSFKNVENFLEKEPSDYIILNSVSMISNIKNSLRNYENIELYFDNDEAGNRALEMLKNELENIEDCRVLYSDFKDLNEYLTQQTNEVQQQYKPRFKR